MAAVLVLQSVLLGLGLLVPTIASAQGPSDSTGTGGSPNSTITAPNTTATGVTKPPGAEEGPETPRDRRELEQIKRQDDRIENSICDGCK